LIYNLITIHFWFNGQDLIGNKQRGCNRQHHAEEETVGIPIVISDGSVNSQTLDWEPKPYQCSHHCLIIWENLLFWFRSPAIEIIATTKTEKK
jgi:hypothetical protein